MAVYSASLAREVGNTSLPEIDSLLATLERDGAVQLPPLVDAGTLREMQAAFQSRLMHLRSNYADGCTRTELKRRTVEDVLMLEQGFIDIGLHPLVTGLARRYIGNGFALCEAKGWETLEAGTDFHGWHGDMWYDKDAAGGTIPREIKLAFYLNDVGSGCFQYIKRSHQRAAPDLLTKQQAEGLPFDDMIEFKGPAGTAVVFDTSGIHRQGIPVLHRRQAVFYNYHDPSVPLQSEDVAYYRYHPLYLNAAFLGDLGEEERRILGFGNKARYQPHFIRKPRHPSLNWLQERAIAASLATSRFRGRVTAKLGRMLGSR